LSVEFEMIYFYIHTYSNQRVHFFMTFTSTTSKRKKKKMSTKKFVFIPSSRDNFAKVDRKSSRKYKIERRYSDKYSTNHTEILNINHKQISLENKLQSHQKKNLLIPKIAVRAMGMDENYSQALDENIMALIESPLIAPANSHFRQHYKTALYPYNITSHAANANGGGIYSTNDHELNGNGDGEGPYNSVEKQSRYQPQKCVNVKICA
jgi:hypothetical protein